MFDFVHERKRLVQVVLALIVLPFALWGVDSYRKSGEVAPLAKVNGEKVSQQEFENAMEQQRERLRQMMGPRFDPALFDKPEVKHSVLDGLVTQHLLFDEAHKVGLTVSDEQMAQLIATVEAFKKKGEGEQEAKFDKQRYEAALAAQGMTPAMFEYRVRRELMTRQLTDAYAQNGFAADAVAEKLVRLYEQQRVVSVSELDFESFMKQAKVDEAAVKSYFEKNQLEFQLPERARVEYVVFSVDSLLPQMAATDEEIKAYYDEHVNEFSSQEERQAAHILISLPKQGSDAEKQAAKSKAEEVLQQVKQTPGRFSELAKQYSQDPGSAANGGDLGMFGRGMMVKPFEDAAFSLKAGEISGLVQSDFGFHIIKVTAIKPAKAKALGDVRGEIAQRIKMQHASDKFAELAEKFSNAVYEQSDSLKPAAELVRATVQNGGWLSKGQAAVAPWNDKALQAVFSDDVLKNKRNTAAIEVAPSALLAARVTEYQPASVRALAEVSNDIREKLKKQQATESVLAQGKKLLEQLQRGEKVSMNWKAAKPLNRNQRNEIAPELLEAVFRADSGKLPAYVGATTQNGYAVARIDAVKEVESVDEGKRNQMVRELRQLTGEELLTAYLGDARKRADITMKDFTAEEKK